MPGALLTVVVIRIIYEMPPQSGLVVKVELTVITRPVLLRDAPMLQELIPGGKTEIASLADVLVRVLVVLDQTLRMSEVTITMRAICLVSGVVPCQKQINAKEFESYLPVHLSHSSSVKLSSVSCNGKFWIIEVTVGKVSRSKRVACQGFQKGLL